VIVLASLTDSGCAVRRRRFVELLATTQLDAAVITDVRDCYYFTGTLAPDDLPMVLAVDQNGSWHCVGPAEFEVKGCDTFAAYEWNNRGTRNPDSVDCLVAACERAGVRVKGRRIGIHRQTLLARVAEKVCAGGAELVPFDDSLASMQQRKDADEIELIRACVRANLAAYEAVAATIAPGVNELAVLAAGRRGAILGAGEKVFHDGDYQSGSYNGPARDRAIERGELYIVDAWTRYRGYWTDMSRTFAVGTPPTDIQQALYDHIRGIQRELPQILRPGVDGRALYHQVDEMLREHAPLAEIGLIHHAGHAIGLRVHEMPDLNLDRGGTVQTGNIICVEPGGYFYAARHGVRLENMYLITESGCEDLSPGEIDLLVCG
jgi:Xaa-Pro dipeptidase